MEASLAIRYAGSVQASVASRAVRYTRNRRLVGTSGVSEATSYPSIIRRRAACCNTFVFPYEEDLADGAKAKGGSNKR